MKSGHLHTEWRLNDSIKTKVLLETGFPEIVINESFAQSCLSDLKTEEARDSAYIALWGGQDRIKVSYLIKDTVMLNNKQVAFKALVADLSSNKSWKNSDIIYPIRDLNEAVEINIKEKYMVVGKDLNSLDSDFIKINVKSDMLTKGLYLNTTLQIYDEWGKKEKLKGNFLFDLGAANAIFVNRNIPEVETFIVDSDRFILKDTTRFKPNAKTKLAIIMPTSFQVENMVLTNNFIVAMKMYKSKRSDKYVGVIGNRFFMNFDMIFDFKGNRIYMKPNSDNIHIKN